MEDNKTPPQTDRGPIKPSTPPIIKSTTSESYRFGSLDEARTVLVRTVGCSTVSFDDLLGSLFPYVQSKDTDNVTRDLQAKGIVTERGWEAFSEIAKRAGIYEPKNSHKKEGKTFEPFETVFRTVSESVSPNSKPQVRLSIHGDKLIATDWPNRTRPDGSIHLRDANSSVATNQSSVLGHIHICCYIELKKVENERNRKDNEQKLLWNAHHKLRSDPCCRFVTGITIENTRATFWYFDRASVLRGRPFDFMREPEKLIRIYLGYILAPSGASLGLDTSIRRLESKIDAPVSPTTKPGQNPSPIYEIRVHDSPSKPIVFLTTKCLADFGAIGICGRGTRVWEVSKVGDTDVDRRYVLKDVWIDENRALEGETLDEIHRDGRSDMLQYFLKPECYGMVFIKGIYGAYEEDKTLNLRSVESPVPIQYPQSETPSTSTSGTSGRQSGPNASWGCHDYGQIGLGAPPVAPKWGPRKHYRIVFNEPPGRPIHQLKSYGEAFQALLGGLEAMQAMLHKKLIHRDISVGNILLVDRGDHKVGVLMDLEYAKKFPDNDDTRHGVRTGTKQFMALEVIRSRYIFLEKGKFTWSHNPIHDVESAWWIAVWVLYYFPGSMLTESDKELRSQLFTTADWIERWCYFTKGDVAEACWEGAPKRIAPLLEEWRLALLRSYRKQQDDVKGGSRERFDYNGVITDAITRVKRIRDVLIETQPGL